MRKMVIDTANLLFRVAAVNSRYNSGDPEEKAGLAMHMALNTVNKFYKNVQPEQVAMTFEGQKNWRKTYTAGETILKRKYKANRVKDPSMIPFFELIAGFEDMVRNHTSIICLQHPECEGDDMVAAYCQYNMDDEIYVISGDSDFEQLLRYPNVDILKPNAVQSFRSEFPDFDAEYFIFEKCMRGDKKDNVFSAYPNLRATKILAAYKNEQERIKLFNTELESMDEDGKVFKYKVGDAWKENQLLLDLECQPDDIKLKMFETVEKETQNHGKFNMFYFQKFLGKYGLKQISDNITLFENLFSVTHKNSTFKEQQKVNTNVDATKRKDIKELISF